jgi:hypothetical protein
LDDAIFDAPVARSGKADAEAAARAVAHILLTVPDWNTVAGADGM